LLFVVGFVCGVFIANSTPLNKKFDHRVQKNLWDEYQLLAFVSDPILPVQLLLDISTSDIWMYSDDCKSCPDSMRKRLTASKSLTTNDAQFNLDFTLRDNDKSGSIEGQITNDYLLLVPEIHDSKKTKKHNFALVTSMSGADETVDPYGSKQDGRIGLGLNTKSSTSTIDLLFGTYDKLLCLIRADNELSSSKLLLGQKMLDQQVEYKKITSSQVVDSNNGLWIVPLGGYVFGKYSMTKALRAQLSTTTSFIGVPPMLYSQVLKQLSAYESNGQLLMAKSDLSKAPELQLKINDLRLKIQASDYIVDKPNDANKCIVKIRKLNTDNDFVLGTSFLDTLSFCLNYDTKTVDFLDVTQFKD